MDKESEEIGGCEGVMIILRVQNERFFRIWLEALRLLYNLSLLAVLRLEWVDSRSIWNDAK